MVMAHCSQDALDLPPKISRLVQEALMFPLRLPISRSVVCSAKTVRLLLTFYLTNPTPY